MPNLNDLPLAQIATDAIQKVFSTMVSIELEKTEYVPDAVGWAGRRFAGSIGLGGRVSGLICVYLPEDLARQAAVAMLGMPPEDASPEDMSDILSELCNMIGGTIKSRLSDEGFSCELSLPSVMHGRNFRIETPGFSSGRAIEAAFRHDVHLVRISLALREDAGEGRRAWRLGGASASAKPGPP